MYGIRKGRLVGIVNTREECINATKGYIGAEFKQFEEFNTAADYVGEWLLRPTATENVKLSEVDALTKETLIVFAGSSRLAKLETTSTNVIAYVNGWKSSRETTHSSYYTEEVYAKLISDAIGLSSNSTKKIVLYAWDTKFADLLEDNCKKLKMLDKLGVHVSDKYVRYQSVITGFTNFGEIEVIVQDSESDKYNERIVLDYGTGLNLTELVHSKKLFSVYPLVNKDLTAETYETMLKTLTAPSDI